MEFGLIYHAQHAGFCSELIPLLSYICNHPFCSKTLYEKLCFPPFLLVQSNKTLLYSAQAWLWSNLLFYCWIYFWYLKFVKDYCFDVVSLYSGKKLESNSHDLKLFCKVFTFCSCQCKLYIRDFSNSIFPYFSCQCFTLHWCDCSHKEDLW